MIFELMVLIRFIHHSVILDRYTYIKELCFLEVFSEFDLNINNG